MWDGLKGRRNGSSNQTDAAQLFREVVDSLLYFLHGGRRWTAVACYIVTQLLAVDAGDYLQTRQAEAVAEVLEETCGVEAQVPFHLWKPGEVLSRLRE